MFFSCSFVKRLNRACGRTDVSEIRQRILTALAITLLTVTCAGLTRWIPSATADSESSLADALVRLHVIANSDTFEDQALKLEVRDAVLDAAREILEGATGKKEAMELICSHLDELESAAAEAVQRAGYDYSVSVSSGRFGFPDRFYGTLFVPAGEYDAVKVVIGAGKGSNWWCVMFPPLCFIDVSLGQTQAQAPSAPHQPDAELGFRLNTETSIRSDNALERLERQVQRYVASLEQGGPSTGTQEGVASQTGLVARLESEIGKIKQQLGSQKYAIQSWLWFF